MKYNTEEVNGLIRHRRSTFPKDYTGEIVDDQIVRQMVENACWAPSHKLTEPWRFVVFCGPGLSALARFQGECYRKVTSADGTYKEDRYQNLITKPLLSSHIIAVGMKRDEKKSLPEQEELGAVYCAIQNMYLTATAYGVGCYFSSGGITYMEEAKAFFGLGREDKLLGFMHVGIPKGPVPDSRRKPVTEKAIWVQS
jgi:nitroreductase